MPRGQGDSLAVTVDAASFRALLGKSSELEPKLKAALRKRIRQAAGTAADEVRSTVLAGPGEAQTGLRQGIAAGVKVAVMTGARAGVTITSSGSALDPRKRPLVRAYDKPGGWRHPVYGNTDRWVTQQGTPYFSSVIDKHRGDFTDAVTAAMQEAADSLL